MINKKILLCTLFVSFYGAFCFASKNSVHPANKIPNGVSIPEMFRAFNFYSPELMDSFTAHIQNVVKNIDTVVPSEKEKSTLFNEIMNGIETVEKKELELEAIIENRYKKNTVATINTIFSFVPTEDLKKDCTTYKTMKETLLQGIEKLGSE